jgi:hypothetical protein
MSKYRIFYPDIKENEDDSFVNGWIYLEDKEIPDYFTYSDILKLLIGNNEQCELEDLDEAIYILKDGNLILKVEPILD